MKLVDHICSQLDPDPVRARAKLDAMSNSELIELISGTVNEHRAIVTGESSCMPVDYDED